MKIGHDYITDQEAQRQSWNKLALLGKAVAEHCKVTKQSSIDNLKDFEKSILEFTYNTIRTNHPEGSILNLTNDLFASLYGYDLTTLKALAEQYNTTSGNIEYNTKTNVFDVPVDRSGFDILATTKTELAKLKDTQELCAIINRLLSYDDTGINLNGIILYKYIKTNEQGTALEPNHQFIKMV